MEGLGDECSEQHLPGGAADAAPLDARNSYEDPRPNAPTHPLLQADASLERAFDKEHVKVHLTTTWTPDCWALAGAAIGHLKQGGHEKRG
eukprot:8173212-Pyramimonas_sp.AAC.1